jgi:hypothetical protein
MLLTKVQEEQRSLAVAGHYTGDFDFAARLQQPMQPVDAESAATWLAEHPRGLVVTFTRDWQPAPDTGFKLAYEVPYRNQAVRLWETPPVEVVPPVTPVPPAIVPLPGKR